MAQGREEIRQQVNELWDQALEQLEEVKDALGDRLGTDMVRMRRERDRLLRRLGEQTHRLASQGRLTLPTFVRGTVDRLNDVIEGLVETEDTRQTPTKSDSSKASGSPPPKVGAKPTRKPAKKATKKTSKKKATKQKATKKKTASKKAKKVPGRKTSGKTTKKKAVAKKTAKKKKTTKKVGKKKTAKKRATSARSRSTSSRSGSKRK